MHNLVFFTDYSDSSFEALNYLAGLLEDAPDSNVYLVHAYAVTTRSGMLLSVKERVKDDATALLNNRKRKLEGLIDPRHLVFSKAISGQISKVATRLVKQLNADLIVAAMWDENSKSADLLGQQASALLKQTTVPLLLIPDGAKYQKIENITFALKNPEIHSKSTIHVLNDFFNTSDPNLNILLTKTAEKGGLDAAKLNLASARLEVKQSSEASIYEAIMKEQEAHKADLLAVVRRKRGFFERMISQGSFSKNLLDIDIPMLVLRGAVV